MHCAVLGGCPHQDGPCPCNPCESSFAAGAAGSTASCHCELMERLNAAGLQDQTLPHQSWRGLTRTRSLFFSHWKPKSRPASHKQTHHRATANSPTRSRRCSVPPPLRVSVCTGSSSPTLAEPAPRFGTFCPLKHSALGPASVLHWSPAFPPPTAGGDACLDTASLGTHHQPEPR